MSTLERLERLATRAKIRIEPQLSEKLRTYYDLLIHWNTRIKLTSARDPDLYINRLLIEPLIAARKIPARDISLLDVGSGGGSPSIPLKLARPRLSLTMVESKVKKAAFLREAVRILDLQTAKVETERCEDLLLRQEFREAMAFVSVRAVRIDKALLNRLQAFLAPGGQILLFRGPSGPDVPVSLGPTLYWQETIPLVEALRSRLVILEKVTADQPEKP